MEKKKNEFTQLFSLLAFENFFKVSSSTLSLTRTHTHMHTNTHAYTRTHTFTHFPFHPLFLSQTLFLTLADTLITRTHSLTLSFILFSCHFRSLSVLLSLSFFLTLSFSLCHTLSLSSYFLSLSVFLSHSFFLSLTLETHNC